MSSLARSTRLLSVLTLFSRLLGLVREQLLAALLAAGPAADAFIIAFRIPNLLRDLFAEGALSAAFVPTFIRVDEERGREAAYALGQRVFGVLFVIVGVLTLCAYAFTDPLVRLIAPGFEQIPGKLALTQQLTQVMLPFLMCVSFAAVAMGMLNAQKIFGPPAASSSAFNVVAIVVGAGLAVAAFPPERTAWGWAVGVVLGGLAQFLVQLPALYKAGFKLRLHFALDDDVKQMLKLMAPATVGLAATQLNIFINSNFASAYPGANAYLTYAFRLLYLPIGVFGVAIATVSTSSLSRQVASGDLAAVRKTVRQALSLLAFLTVPSSVGLWVLASPIIAMIFQRRAFTLEHTQAVAQATALYAIGLFAYSAVKVLAPVYYAKQRSRVPLLASFAAIAANITASYFLREQLGFAALALALSIGAWCNVGVLYFADYSGEDAGERRQAVLSFARVLVAAAGMGVFGHYAQQYLPAAITLGEAGRWATGLGLTALCGCVYLLLCVVMRVPEVEIFTGLVKRKLKR